MLAVVCVLVYLYINAGASILSTWRQARGDDAQVSTMQSQNDALRAQRNALEQPGTIVSQARQLGMVRLGEQAFVVQGLPSN
jgi:cell division protein FtsB